MFAYILLAAFAAFCGFVETGKHSKRDMFFFHIVMFVFLLVVGLRYYHGDYPTYEWGYENDIDVGDDHGYYFVQMLFHHMGFSFGVFVFLITLLSVYCFYKAFAMSQWPLFGVVILLGKIFTLYAMSGIRQYISMAICWWALAELLVNRRRVFFFVAVWVAYTMHASAIIFFPVFFLTKLKFTYRNVLIIIGVSILIGAYSNLFFTSVSQSSDLVNDRFGGYIEVAAEAGERMNVLNYAENFFFLGLAFWVRKRIINRVPFYDVFLYMFVIYCSFLIIGNQIGVVKRLRDFFVISYAIVVPSYLYLFRGEFNKRIFKLIGIAYFIFLMFRSIAVYDAPFEFTNYRRMVPYHSIFEKY